MTTQGPFGPFTGPVNGKSVQVHGWQVLPCGSQSHVDAWRGDERVDGFCVYLRTELDPDGFEPFEITQEADFKSEESADNYAMQLAMHNACQIDYF